MPLLRHSLIAARALALAGLGLLPATALAADRTDAPLDDGSEDSISGEAAVFARFGDLGAEATEKRLSALLAKRDSAKLVAAVTERLAKDGVTTKDVERTILVLIKGLKEADADTTLAALMLDYYEQQVQERLAAGKLGVDDVFDLMTDRADVVVTAAYGSVSPRDSRSARARSIRRLKRRT